MLSGSANTAGMSGNSKPSRRVTAMLFSDSVAMRFSTTVRGSLYFLPASRADTRMAMSAVRFVNCTLPVRFTRLRFASSVGSEPSRV